MRQLVYTMLITNNHASFHLWWEENLISIKESQNYTSMTVVRRLFQRLVSAAVIFKENFEINKFLQNQITSNSFWKIMTKFIYIFIYLYVHICIYSSIYKI